MKRFFAIVLLISIVATLFVAIGYQEAVGAIDDPNNLFTTAQSTFEGSTTTEGWTAFGGGTLSVSSDQAHSGTKSLCLTGRQGSWYSPAYNIYSKLKAGGAGTYAFGFWVYVTPQTVAHNGRIIIRGDEADANSFISNQAGNYYGVISDYISTPGNEWTYYTGRLKVLGTDLTRDNGNFNLMIDILDASSQNIYFDDIQIDKLPNDSIFNGNFEKGLIGWSVFDSGSASISTEKHLGTYCAKYNRTGNYSSIAYSVQDILNNGGAGYYLLTYWIKLEDSNNNTETYTTYFSSNYNTYHKELGNVSVTNQWTRYSQMINITSDDISTNLVPATRNVQFRLQGSSATSGWSSYYIDDVRLSYEGTTGLATLGKYGYDFSFKSNKTSTTFFYRLDNSLGSDVFTPATQQGQYGSAAVVIKNTSGSAFNAYLDTRSSSWGMTPTCSSIVNIPPGQIRTIRMNNNIPYGNNILLLQISGANAGTTFTIGNITRIDYSNELVSGSLNKNQTDIYLNTLIPGDNYTPQ